MSKKKILITRRWPQAVEKCLQETYDVTLNDSDTPMSEEALSVAMNDYDAILPTVTDKLGSVVFEHTNNHRVKIIANFGVGFSHIDINAAKKANIMVTNTPDVLSECTADIAMTLLLMVARRASEGERELRVGAWSGWRPTHLIGHKVSGKTLGIIGFGRIGQEMAHRAHFGFGIKILVKNRSKVAPEVLAKYNATQVDTIEALMPQCDFISLHCPGGAENIHLINSARLELMKPTGVLINTARGEVIDEAALANALERQSIGGAGLDVFDEEPKINPRLLKLNNISMLPHLGSATLETRESMGFRSMSNIDSFFAGEEPLDRVV